MNCIHIYSVGTSCFVYVHHYGNVWRLTKIMTSSRVHTVVFRVTTCLHSAEQVALVRTEAHTAAEPSVS